VSPLPFPTPEPEFIEIYLSMDDPSSFYLEISVDITEFSR
jgi:hypothetical protein